MISMNIRTFVTFQADFPDDSQWDEDQNLLVAGGWTVATWLSQRLERSGCECSDVAQQSFYGWRFDACMDKQVIRCILQGGDPWLMICEARVSRMRRLMGLEDRAPLRDLLVAVHQVLAGDSRFSVIRWLTREEYESGRESLGVDSPISPG